MFNTVAMFLLNHPPLEEIGGSVVDVVENYREGFISKEKALVDLLTNHKDFLEKYINQSISNSHSYVKKVIDT